MTIIGRLLWKMPVVVSRPSYRFRSTRRRMLAAHTCILLLAAAAAQPLPEPPVPSISSGLTSTNVFWRGQRASDGTTYPCIRIPSIIRAAPRVLLAFAECLHTVGGGCDPIGLNGSSTPSDICSRRSTDAGASWGALVVL